MGQRVAQVVRRKGGEADVLTHDVGDGRPVVGERDLRLGGPSRRQVVAPNPAAEAQAAVVSVLARLPGDGPWRVEHLDPVGYLQIGGLSSILTLSRPATHRGSIVSGASHHASPRRSTTAGLPCPRNCSFEALSPPGEVPGERQVTAAVRPGSRLRARGRLRRGRTAIVRRQGAGSPPLPELRRQPVAP
jgi:hypothetical protein